MTTILQLDAELFYFINTTLSNSFFDTILPWIRNKYFWAPLYAFVAVFLAINFPQNSWKIILLVIVVIFVSDQLSSTIIKPLVHRLRPCKDLLNIEHLRLLISCGSGFSFPSSHAANHFAFAMFFFKLFPNKWVLFLGMFWAAIISFAQVYVGVHYPLDVLGGMALGLFCGNIIAELGEPLLKPE